jgi:hypothetical protein
MVSRTLVTMMSNAEVKLGAEFTSWTILRNLSSMGSMSFPDGDPPY